MFTPMVRAEKLEQQVAAYVGGMTLPQDLVDDVIAELQSRRGRTDQPKSAARLKRQIEKWRRLFVLEEIDEDRYRRETAPIKENLAALDDPEEPLDIERAIRYLQDVGSLWAESPRSLQRTFLREVFQRIVVRGPEIIAITPTGPYAPLFHVDRHERFGRDFCRLAPRAGLEPAT